MFQLDKTVNGGKVLLKMLVFAPWTLLIRCPFQTPFVSKGHRAEEAVELLKEFYKGENPHAPEEKRKPRRK